MTIINTKLTPPSGGSRIIARSELVEKLREYANGLLTLISAPSGYGKTSAVCQWTLQTGISPAWLSLDSDDNDPDRFFRYLLSAIKTTDPSLASAFDPLINAQKLPSGTNVIAHIINRLSNHTRKLYLILDDFHKVTDPLIHQAVCFLLEHSPPGLHLTIISRHDLPFSISRYRADKSIQVITAEELKFSRAETLQYLRRTATTDVSQNFADELHRFTEGWIIGIQIVCLSYDGKEDWLNSKPKRPTADALLFDYLADEVLQSLPDEVREFCLKTSFLLKIQAELCEEITGYENAAEILVYLEKSNLFLIPLDAEKSWFRYHQLFSVFLQSRLKAKQDDFITNNNRKAAYWLADRGYTEDAFNQAAYWNDWHTAADILEDALPFLITNHEWVISRNGSKKIPGELRQQYLLLKIYYVLIVFLMGDLENAESLIKDVERDFSKQMELYAAEKRDRVRDFWNLAKVYKLSSTGQHEKAIETVKSLIDPTLPKDKFIHGMLEFLMAIALIEKGDIRPAKTALGSALVNHTITSKHCITHNIWYYMVAIEKVHGRLQQAEASLNDVLDFSKQNELLYLPSIAVIHLQSAHLHFLRDKLDEALAEINTGLEYTKLLYEKDLLFEFYQLEAFYLASQRKSGISRKTDLRSTIHSKSQ